RVVGLNKTITKPPVAYHANGRVEACRHALVRVARSDTNEAWPASAEIRPETPWKPDIHQFALHIIPWRYVLVSQTQIHRHAGTKAPGVLKEIGLACGPVLRDAERTRTPCLVENAKHVVRKAVTSHRVADGQGSANFLRADHVVVVAADLGADLHRMAAADP